MKLTFAVASGSFLGDTLKWCMLSSKHLRVKKQLSLARSWGKNENVKIKTSQKCAKVIQNSHKLKTTDVQLFKMRAYQTLSVRERLAASPSPIGCCIRPSQRRERERKREVQKYLIDLLLKIGPRDWRSPATYCLEYQDRTPSWRTTQ